MTITTSILPIQEGSVGDAVVKVQGFLTTLELYSSKIDGSFGAKTKEAVIKFQTANTLSKDGVVGKNTAIALDNKAWAAQQPILQEGSKGAGVKELQRAYNAYFAGDSILTIDGIFAAKTKAEVIKFQKSHNLTADGVVGAKTWSSLRSLQIQNIPTDDQRISFIFTGQADGY